MDPIKSVRFYDKNLHLMGETQEATVIYDSRWHTYGQFEIHLPCMAPYVKVDNRILFDRDERKNGVIKYIHVDDDGSVTIKGFSLLWFFTDRLTLPAAGEDYVAYNAPAEDIMTDLVRRNAVECEDEKRILPGFAVEASKKRGGVMIYQSTYGNLAEELTAISQTSMLGIGVRMDTKNKQYVFEVLEGADKTSRQHERPPVIFRRSYGNIQSAEYTLNDSATKNCAYTAGRGEGAARAVYIVNGSTAGFDRREIFVDARDIEDVSELPDRGRTKLAGMVPQENFEAEVTTEWYKKRWNLGDMVTVIDDDTGITLDHYISEIQDVLDENGYEVVPTFGVPERSISSSTGSGSSSYGGSGGGDISYIHTQQVAASTWEIAHNLGKFPSVTVVDSSGSVVMGETSYIDRNHVKLTFSAALSGAAYLN